MKLRKGEFFHRLIDASLEVVRRYNEAAIKQNFDWLVVSTYYSRKFGILIGNTDLESAQTQEETVEAVSRLAMQRNLDMPLRVDHFPLFEDAWDCYERAFRRVHESGT